jgi:hypothetical protein
VTLDEIRLVVRVPVGLPEAAYVRMARALAKARFRRRLRTAVRRLCRRYPTLDPATVRVT